jgi:hypothetical protein
MLLLIDIFSINKGQGYENPSLEIIVIECYSTGGCPLEEACEHFFLMNESEGMGVTSEWSKGEEVSYLDHVIIGEVSTSP